jgi:hypothetical protein
MDLPPFSYIFLSRDFATTFGSAKILGALAPKILASLVLQEDLASLVLHGLLSAEAKNQLLLLKVMDARQDGMRSGAGGWPQLESGAPGQF